MRKARPATLTSTLLARKGEAEPARLSDGTVPRDVIALQEELVARVAADISHPPRPPEPETAAATPASENFPAGPKLDAPSLHAGIDGKDEDDKDELGAAPIELPPNSADEPDYDPAGDAEAVKESQITLADWTARAQSGDTPFAYERMSDAESQERSALIPLALGIAVVAVLATLAIWQVSDHGIGLPPGAEQSSAPQPQPLPPLAPASAENHSAPAPANASNIRAEAPAADALPTLGTTTAPETRAAPAAEKPAAAMPAPAPLPPAPTGGYVVQLVSTLSQATAEQAWTKIAPKLSAIGEKAPHAIEQADLGTKGTRYRVELTGFSGRGAAQKACETLKAHKLSCLVLNNK